jgi:hypothetical protein
MDDASRRIASSHRMRKVFLAIFSFSVCVFSLRLLPVFIWIYLSQTLFAGSISLSFSLRYSDHFAF